MFILELFEIDWTEVFAKVYGLLRKILFLIDSLGLTFIDDGYNLMISAISAFDGDKIAQLANDIAKNCYIIIGIFALFRIALLLVNIIIDPDKLTDKSQGVGNILVRLVITLVLFVMVPFIFDMSRELQKEIIDNNYISKILIGSNLTGGTGNPGTVMKDIAVRSLIYPDPIVYDAENKKIKCTGDCEIAVKNWQGNASYEVISYHLPDYVMDGGSAVYVLKYTPIIVLLVGGFITFVLFSFAIDIALRSVELAVLEIIAPMFLVTYIDPKSSTNGPFKRWLTACGKTYLNLFIKIIVICLMLLFISKLNTILSTVKESTGLLQLLVYIAILIFAKKAPKWLADMIGVGGSNLGGLGIGKKLGEAALIGGAVTKGIGAAKGAAKKWGTHKAKRIGAGAVNRLGANVGGSIAGISAARKNALDNKSYRSIREKALAENGGSKIKARLATAKSFFDKEDRAERRKALKSVDYKGSIKEARLSASASGTKAALDGKFVSAISLGRDVKKQYDPGYKTHDEKKLAAAETKFYTNTGAFDMAKINYQKKIRADLEESSRILGKQTFEYEGDIYLDSAHTVPAIYNEKTIKKFAGEHVTTFTDLGAAQLTGYDKDTVVARQKTEIMVEDKSGNLVKAEVEAGTMLKQVVDADGKVRYNVLMSAAPIKDSTGNIVDVKMGGKVSSDKSARQIETTADGYVVRNDKGDVVTKVVIAKDGTVQITDDRGHVIKGDNMQQAIENLAYSNVGGKESIAAKNLDASFTAVIEGNASKFISYEEKIGEANSHIVELQAKKAEQISLQRTSLESSKYGLTIAKIRGTQGELKNINGELSILDSILATAKGAPTVEYNGMTYDVAALNSKKSDLLLSKEKHKEIIRKLRDWEASEEGKAAYQEYISLESEINDNVSAIDEQIRGEERYISGIEAEKRKVYKDVAPIMFEGTEVTSANYESLRTEISKKKESKEKIAKGALGVPLSSGDKNN